MELLRIRAASAVRGTVLRLTLSDGTVVERDVGRLLEGPVFAPLRGSSAEFARCRVEDGTVTWPNGADLCPDVLIWGGRAPTRPRQPPASFLAVEVPPEQDAANRLPLDGAG